MKPADIMPGWRISRAQHRLFFQLWHAACAWQGWDKLPSAEREDVRHATLAACGYQSARDINSTDGFDTVKKYLEALAGKVHNEPGDAGARRRLLVIVRELMRDLGAAGYAPAAGRILRERFCIIGGVRTLADLDSVELLNVVKTLRSRLATARSRIAARPQPRAKSLPRLPCPATNFPSIEPTQTQFLLGANEAAT